MIKLVADDGHELDAYVAIPKGVVLGAVIVLQEIFGVNAHIRSVADGYAREGYVAIAPALFDRVERGVELRYEGKDMKTAVALLQKLSPVTALLDIGAAFKEARREAAKIAVVGFCYGGFLSWLASTRGKDVRVEPDCCVGYYPGGIGKVADEQPLCPVMLHFGANDTHIKQDQVESVRAAHPEVEVYVYDGAEHGFNCDARASFNLESAKLAGERTSAFLKRHLA